MKQMPRLLAPGRRTPLARVTLLTLVQGLGAAAAAFATRALFEALHAGAPDLPLFPMVVLGLSGLVVATSRIAARVQGERLAQSYVLDLRAALFEHAAGMAACDVAARRSGYMSLRFVGDMTAFRNWAGRGVPRLVAGGILIPATLAVLGLLSPALLLAVLPPLGIGLVLILAGGLRLAPLHRRLRARRGRIAAEMAERMTLAPDLDRLGRRNKELHRLHRQSGRMIETALARLRLAETLTAIPEMMAGLTAVLILLIGAREGLGTGTIAAALSALGLLLAPMRDLATVWNLHAGWRAAQEKCAAALARRQRPPYGTRGLSKGPVSLRIEALELPGHPKFSCTLAAGEAVRIALGERAETALFNILLGRDPKPAGQIQLSGIPLDELSRGALRRNLCRIGPDVPMLQGSLRRALIFGTGISIDDAVLRDRIRHLRLDEVLCPDGDLDRRITEGGRTLSLSERTAVSLVRASLCHPRILLIGQDFAAARPEVTNAVQRWIDGTTTTVIWGELLEVPITTATHAASLQANS
jgi:ABC-type multidrug transport system, ATPase and permease components